MISPLVVVDDLAVANRDISLCWWQTMTVGMRITHTSPRHESVTTGSQFERISQTNRHSAVGETDSPGVRATGRQWCPSAIVVVVTPRHPGRSPQAIRHPTPAPDRMIEPSSIVKRKPPGIVRLPVPPVISVKPAPAITIRLPALVHHDNRRLPAPTVICRLKPRTVW